MDSGDESPVDNQVETVDIGRGSEQDISDEVEIIVVKSTCYKICIGKDGKTRWARLKIL